MGSLIRDDAWLIVAVASISIQMEMSSILTLDAIDRAIGDFLVGLPVQRPPDRKLARCVFSNNLNAANRLAPRPLPNGLQALFSKSPVAHSDCFPLRHAANIYSSLTAISRCAISLIIRFERRFFLTAASGPVKVTSARQRSSHGRG